MKEFLNTLMIGNWVKYIGKGDGYYQRIGPSLLKDFYYQDNEEVSEKTIKPVLLSKKMFELNGFKSVTDANSKDDVYTKRVQEGPNNDEYDISVHFHADDITQIWVQKVIRTVVWGEEHEWLGMLCRVKYVHTFQNWLNITGLKETAEEFNIM